MKKTFVLIAFTSFFYSCNKTPNIIGEWKVGNWAGQSYTVFNLEAKSSKTLFDDFIYSLFADNNRKLILNADSNFIFTADSSKRFQGKFNYISDSTINLKIEGGSQAFSILYLSNDSLAIYARTVAQIPANNVKLSLKNKCN